MEGNLYGTKERKITPLWDSFKDPEPEKNTGSLANWKKFNKWLKILKFFVYILIFMFVLATSIVSKYSYLLMASHTKNKFIKYCDIRRPQKEVYAVIPEIQAINWIWALIISYSIPELFTFLRMSRICYFKKVEEPLFVDMTFVSALFLFPYIKTALMEILHTIGIALFTFLIIPNFNSVQAIMLISCVGFLPSVLNSLTLKFSNFKANSIFAINIFSLLFQIIGYGLWPLQKCWYVPIVLIIISFRWWENYASNLKANCFTFITNIRLRLAKSRPKVFLFVSPLKILIFMLTAFLIDGENFLVYFSNFFSCWSVHDIQIKEKPSLYTDHNNNTGLNETNFIKSSPTAHYYIFFIHIITSYLCYVCSKFACKIKMQELSFSLPLSINTPIALVILSILYELKHTNSCLLHNFLPDYLSLTSFSYYNFNDVLQTKFLYIWLLWWLSQLWITRHIWHPTNNKNASTQKLFVAPWYSSFIIDQCMVMNRRRLDHEKFLEYLESVTFFDPEKLKKDSLLASDSIPQLIVCATMWHETEDEMLEFLKSIIRLDEDQCARRMAQKYFGVTDEYYELEVNIFFDDAFMLDKRQCADLKKPPINEYVKLLINSVPKAAEIIHNAKIRIRSPVKIETPYGGRLEWTLPGRTKMIAHLKNNDKIRNKKRWSQVMYMYYLLGYRIMEMDASPERKTIIAQNTYLLALDGDIDFQPHAVQLLINRMKVEPDLGAACGRIHPVGKGPMVWYQIFEYAIGHWLQKATEHVIGCVLCSPGCFSLFRGRALMENNVMKKYTTVSKQARHYVQYDQGEDRWLCTLLLKQKFKVEYAAASDAYTHSPESFNEFYNQRRRWIPSTIANIFDLLGDAKMIVENNNNISMPYIFYQGMLMIGTILGPGTIFLMMVGAFVTVFSIDIWTSFLFNFTPIFIFMMICLFMDQKHQLTSAFVISTLYCLVMMAVMIGIIVQVIEDSILSPASLFFFAVAAQIVVTGLLHPQEVSALLCGMIYYITIPSMYMLLLIYSVFNMNDVSWGTRDKKPEPVIKESKSTTSIKQSKFSLLQQLKTEEQGEFDFSLGNFFRCMLCTKPKSYTADIHLVELQRKMENLEKNAKGENSETEIKQQPEEIPVSDPVEDEVKEEDSFLPNWLDDPLLQNFIVDRLSVQERKFWKDLIKKYLHPITKTDAEKAEIRKELKELRNIVAFAFIMINALFVLIIVLLQIKKEFLHLRWPFNAKDVITFDETTLDVIIFREYLELDPIGSCFVIFFGIILAVQFVAMLFHRFSTISQILANIELNLFCSFSKTDNESDIINELRGNGVEIARRTQRPRQICEDDSDAEDNDEATAIRRTTVFRLHQVREEEDKIDYNDLQQNFERRFKEGKLKINNIPISRKSVNFVEKNGFSILNRSSVEQLKKYSNGRQLHGNSVVTDA